MKRLAFLLAAVLLFTPACDDDDPLDPSVLLPLRFTADMTAGNEVPAVTNADSGASGRMTLTINVTRDSSNNVTAVSSSEFVVNMTGFPAGTVLTGAHIHAAPAGQNAPVAINTGLAVGEIPVSSSGAASFTKSPPVPITVEQAQNLVNNPAGFYFNVHTQLNLGGAIRAQLVRVQ
jgi:CHRD domain